MKKWLKSAGKLTLFVFFSLLIFKVGVEYSEFRKSESDELLDVMRAGRVFLIQEFKFIPNKYGYTVIRKERKTHD